MAKTDDPIESSKRAIAALRAAMREFDTTMRHLGYAVPKVKPGKLRVRAERKK